MGAEELREKLIQVIHTADESYLKVINDFVEKSQPLEDDGYQMLPDTAKKLIEQSLKESEIGLLTPHKEVMLKFRKKYNLT